MKVCQDRPYQIVMLVDIFMTLILPAFLNFGLLCETRNAAVYLLALLPGNWRHNGFASTYPGYLLLSASDLRPFLCRERRIFTSVINPFFVKFHLCP